MPGTAEKVKAMGQEIFDKAKEEARGDSDVGFEAANRVCDSMLYLASDGKRSAIET